MEELSRLEKASIILCEKMPLDLTLFEEGGICKKPSKYCEHSKKNSNLCHKKTYTGIPLLNQIR